MTGPEQRRERRKAPDWTRRLAPAAGLILISGFHVALLAARLRDATLAEPGVALRWLAGGALAIAAWRLHRRGIPLVSGRAGLVLTLLLMLLHAGAMPPAALGHAEELLVAAPLGIAVALLMSALASRSATRPGRPRPLRLVGSSAAQGGRRHDSGAFASGLVPRPPPALLSPVVR